MLLERCYLAGFDLNVQNVIRFWLEHRADFIHQVLPDSILEIAQYGIPKRYTSFAHTSYPKLCCLESPHKAVF